MATTTFPNTKRLDAWTAEPEALRLVTDPKHPLYDPRVELPIDENLILNIMAHGVLKAVLVRRDGDVLEVLDGRQRVRAAIEANKRLRKEGKVPVGVPVLMRRGDDRDLYGIHVSANEFARSDGPSEKAAKVQRLLDFGKSLEEVAVLFGVTTATIKNWLALLEVAAPVRKAVEAGQLAPTAAARLSRLPREEQVSALADLKSNGTKPTVRAAAKAAAGKPSASPRIRPADELRKLAAWAQHTDYCHVLAWVVGDMDTEELCRLEPSLKAFFA